MNFKQAAAPSRASARALAAPAAPRRLVVQQAPAAAPQASQSLAATLQRAGLAALASLIVAVAPPAAMADLNRFEADAVGGPRA